MRSFDVFDTTLTRNVGSPSSVFILVGRELRARGLSTLRATVFARARVSAEAAARAASTRADISLVDVYARLAILLTELASHVAEAVEVELGVERRLLRAVPATREAVRAARARGQRVVFISDMYLPADFIREELVRHECAGKDDAVYVSGTAGATKRGGELYTHVLEKEGVDAADVSHLGDHREADVQTPRRMGLQAEHFAECHLNRYERVLESRAWETGGLTSLMAGASRLARLSEEAPTTRDTVLRRVFAGVAGPVLTAYVLWVLRRARDRGVERLYFVSRDGEILLRIARSLAPAMGYACDLRYLYGGRQAWYLAGMDALGGDVWEWAFDSGTAVSVDDVIGRLCLEPGDVASLLDSVGLPRRRWGNPLAPAERDTVRSVLSDADVGSLVRRQAGERRELLRRYCRQEGLSGTATTCWALVDIGWSGRAFSYLVRALGDDVVHSPAGFFFGVSRGAELDALKRVEAYFFNQSLMEGYPQTADVHLMEMFCAGSHGLVLGYEEREGVIVPRLASERNTQVLEWGLGYAHRCVEAFARHVARDLSLVDIASDVRPALEELLRLFWHSPSYDEARVIGSFPYQDDQHAERLRPLAQGFGLCHIAKALTGPRRVRHHRATWYDGSMALTRWPMRWGIALAGRFGAWLRRVLPTAAMRQSRRVARRA